MGVFACSTSDGLFECQFGLNRSLNTEQTTYSPIPYDFGDSTEVLKGEISLGRCGDLPFDTETRFKIADWLYKDEYLPLISNDNPDIVYRVKFVDEHQIHLAARDIGYITLSFVCDAPWAWTKPYTYTFDSYNTKNQNTLVVENHSNYKHFNGVEIELTTSMKQYGFLSCKMQQTQWGDPIIRDLSVIIGGADLHCSVMLDIASSSGEYIWIRIPFNQTTKTYEQWTPDSTGLQGNWKIEHRSYGGVEFEFAENKDFIFCLCKKNLKSEFEIYEQSAYRVTEDPSSSPMRYSIRNTRNTKDEDAFVLQDYSINNGVDQIFVEKYKLQPNEVIQINMEKHEVISNNDLLTSRMVNCNKKWITLEPGRNEIEFKGTGSLTIRCQYPILI